MEGKYTALFELAKPILGKTDLLMEHTKRVFEIAKTHFEVPDELEELVYSTIVLHDIGGMSIEEQYEKGPEIAADLLEKLGYDEAMIQEVCELIGIHHEHPEKPSEAFKIIYDSDQLVRLSPEDFHYYDSSDFNWEEMIEMMYFEHARELARDKLEKWVR